MKFLAGWLKTRFLRKKIICTSWFFCVLKNTQSVNLRLLYRDGLDGFTMFTTNDKRQTASGNKKIIFLPVLLAICVLKSCICWKKGDISPIAFRCYANVKIFAIAFALKKRLTSYFCCRDL